MVDGSYDIELTRGFESHREATDPFEFIRQLESYASTDDAGDMSRKSQRYNVWKEGDGDGEKDDPNPKFYNEPPHRIVEGDEDTYPPRFVELSSMWVYLVVRAAFIPQEVRYQRWPHVFPSKDPLRQSWTNKGRAPKIWSDVRNEWVYPIIFNKYQLHGDEGGAAFDIDQSVLTGGTSTHATHEIAEGATCVVQTPAKVEEQGSESPDPVSTEQDVKTPQQKGRGRSRKDAKGKSAPTPKNSPGGESSDSDEPEAVPQPKRKAPGVISEEAPAPKKPQLGRKSRVPAKPRVPPRERSAPKPTAVPTTSHPEPTPPAKKHKGKSTIKTEPQPSPPTKVIDSASGGKRFVVDDSDTDEKQSNTDLLAELAALRQEKAQCDDQLQQAQGKVVLLAAALHSTWNILGGYRERMAEWTGLVRRWTKGADKQVLDNLMDNLADNKEVNNALLKRANATYDEISAFFPALDRITMDDKTFDAWRNETPKRLEKLIEKSDQRVDAMGRVSHEGFV